ncbi:MAG: transcription elongation protein SprT [Alphaproteobacteria bacterium]|nr:transcription elongation protein SprT [Alphaproteobacteria bacterium]
MKNGNVYTVREVWLRSAFEALQPFFAKLGYALPEKIRFAIAFTSTGKRGRVRGECWHPVASDDQHFEIIIRADTAEPVEVLGVLVHELVHTLLPPSVKHGKEFKAIAMRVGLEGRMCQAMPSPILRERLIALAERLGPLPHAKLNFTGASSDTPKKQRARMLKAECSAACGYTIRLSAKWARTGLPVCPINAAHGALICDIPDDSDDEEIKPENA